jgi:CheY-like chemotaxis protein
VLIVEDDEEVRSLASDFLRGAGYHVLTAEDGKEALEISERMGSAIQLLLADVVMPKMRGPELARRLRARFPEIKIAFMSGYLDQDTSREEILQEASVLQKPFSRDALLRQIRGAFDDEFCPEVVSEATYGYPAV